MGRDQGDIQMKCLGCDCDIKENLIEVISCYGYKTTSIIGIEDDFGNGDLQLSYDYDDEERNDDNTELEGYECRICGEQYDMEQLMEIFKEDVAKITQKKIEQDAQQTEVY